MRRREREFAARVAGRSAGQSVRAGLARACSTAIRASAYLRPETASGPSDSTRFATPVRDREFTLRLGDLDARQRDEQGPCDDLVADPRVAPDDDALDPRVTSVVP